MKTRRFIVLSTFAVFAVTMGSLGLYRAILSPKPVVILAKEYPSLGRDEAQIEVVVFEDFLCHTCRYFSMEVFPAIQSTYVESGVAKYVMIPLAFSEHSRQIANAALAVFHQKPDQYFSFVQELFLRYSDAKKWEMSDLVDIASKMKEINLADFKASVIEGRFDPELSHNLQVAKKAMKKNLRTPAVFINGSPMPGISFESLSVQIEAILNGEAGR